MAVADFHAVAGLGELGGRLPADLDADIVMGALGAIGHIVRGSVQHAHRGGHLVVHSVV